VIPLEKYAFLLYGLVTTIKASSCTEHKLLIFTVDIIKVGFVKDFIVIGMIKINKMIMINKKIKDPNI